jgi:hypothetical protein
LDVHDVHRTDVKIVSASDAILTANGAFKANELLPT